MAHGRGRHPSPLERELLGAIPYLSSELVLHTDTALMPRRLGELERALPRHARHSGMTYWLNNLQGHCEGGFAERRIGVGQTLLAKPGWEGRAPLVSVR